MLLQKGKRKPKDPADHSILQKYQKFMAARENLSEPVDADNENEESNVDGNLNQK